VESEWKKSGRKVEREWKVVAFRFPLLHLNANNHDWNGTERFILDNYGRVIK
jgi:hypothetical protein